MDKPVVVAGAAGSSLVLSEVTDGSRDARRALKRRCSATGFLALFLGAIVSAGCSVESACGLVPASSQRKPQTGQGRWETDCFEFKSLASRDCLNWCVSWKLRCMWVWEAAAVVCVREWRDNREESATAITLAAKHASV